jgi:hypothetical protein
MDISARSWNRHYTEPLHHQAHRGQTADPGIPAPPDFTDLTGPQILERNQLYAEAQKEQKEFDNLQKALVNQISTALEDLYIDPLRELYLGLSGLTARTVIAWLMANYGAIMPQELTDNRRKLDEPYNPSNEPFQIVTNRVQQARNFAADGGLTITDAEATNATLGVLEETGVLERAIEVWRDKPTACSVIP